MTWTIKFTREAEKARDRLPADVRRRILRALAQLARDPYSSPNVKALQGGEGFRLRVGDYRIVYRLINDLLVVRVIRIAHRSDVYR